MQSLLAYSLHREEADRLAEAINRVLVMEDRRGRVISFAPSRPLTAHRGIDVLPALLRVSAWPKDYEILWQGPTPPPETLIREWVIVYEKNADIEARYEASRLAFEPLRAEAPRTVGEAVSQLENRLPPSDRQRLAAMARSDLSSLHFTYGLWIRNAWLYGNPALVAACGADEPDDASAMLIRTLWQKVRTDLDRA